MNLSDRKGFTLLEMVISVALLGIIILSVTSVFGEGLLAIKKGQKNTTAYQLANKKFSEICNVDLSDSNGISYKSLCNCIEEYDPSTITPSDDYIPWDVTGSKTIEGKENIASVDYKFAIQISPYDGKDDLKQITITVKWFDTAMADEKKYVINTLITRKVY